LKRIEENEIHPYIDDCMSRQSPPRVSELAERLGLSRVTVNKAIKATFGIAASRYLKAQQLERAKTLLAETTVTTTRAAYVLAFGTRRTFYRRFHAAYRMTPTEFRRRERQRRRRADLIGRSRQ
jgi:AraC-like DNA-binding protein